MRHYSLLTFSHHHGKAVQHEREMGYALLNDQNMQMVISLHSIDMKLDSKLVILRVRLTHLNHFMSPE